MSSLAVFEWSVGMGAWLSVAVVPLLLGIQAKPLRYILFVGVPMIMVSLLYILARVYMAFLHLSVVVLCLMVRSDVVVGLFLLLSLTAIVVTAAKLIEQLHTYPESLSPWVARLVGQLDQGLLRARDWGLRVYLRFRSEGFGVADFIHSMAPAAPAAAAVAAPAAAAPAVAAAPADADVAIVASPPVVPSAVVEEFDTFDPDLFDTKEE